jgi:GNAT superfamily N-acetyltransferase
VQISALTADEYVRDVLPHTFELWADGRTYEAYVADFVAAAAAGLARRGHVAGLRDGATVTASCKLYSREMHWGERSLRATAIGAVFTAPALRGRGYATAMLGALLDREVAAGCDVAYLYSDIAPQFYERLGFVQLPSRLLSLRATSLAGTHAGATPLGEADWPLVRRCFDDLEFSRPWGLRRSPTVWRWIRMRWKPTAQVGVQTVRLLVKSGNSVRAYVFGRRIVSADAFVVDEFAFAGDDGRAVIPALLRSAAGDLARVRGWLPPEPARALLPAGSVRARGGAVLMLVPISPLGRSWWRANASAVLASRGDPVWSTDHI